MDLKDSAVTKRTTDIYLQNRNTMKRITQLVAIIFGFLLIGNSVLAQNEFITTWQTTIASESITIPTFLGETYNYNVDWGDGQNSTNQTGDATHIYTTAGTYTVSITGTFPRIHFNSSGDRLKLQTIEQWGNIVWSSMRNSFAGCSNLTYRAIDAPDLSVATDLTGMFSGCTGFNGAIGNWDMSNVDNMSAMFFGASSFNQDLSAWNTSSVTNMQNMFLFANAFNQDISSWDVSLVTAFANFLPTSGAFSDENYDKLLIGWSKQPLQVGNNLIATGQSYCHAAAARQSIIVDFGWTISDGGVDCNDPAYFITTWQTTTANESITIPTFIGETYNYHVNWGDNSSSTNQTGAASHIYTTAGTYTVTITGTFPRIYFDFLGDRTKIQTIEQWGDIAWSSMGSAFAGCTNLTYNATDTPNLGAVTDMSRTFYACSKFNGTIGNWNVGNITNMAELFRDATDFNQDIRNWNVSKVTNMVDMFNGASSFNQRLSTWDVSQVTNMGGMFAGATSFNQDIGRWDVGKVTDMIDMFSGASSFNQDISGWNVSEVTRMAGMFVNASSFNQNLGNWNIGKVSNMSLMLFNTGLSIANYDKTLIGWSKQTLQIGNSLNATGQSYCHAAGARQSIIDDFGWTISDGGQDCANQEFITTWEATATELTITIPTTGSGYDFTVDWGDGQSDANQTTHTYSVAGIYTVTITGEFPRIHFNQSIEAIKIQSIEQWGTITWSSMERAFAGCANLTYNATDAPDLSQVTNMGGMFEGAFIFNGAIDHWDVSNVTNMNKLFRNAKAFNQDLTNWDVSKVTNMFNMFGGADSFNGDISNWNVSNVINMWNLFALATAFNQDISNWDVSNVATMTGMFSGTSAFNQDIGSWNTSNVTDMGNMFSNATAFNQDISSWNMAKVTSIDGMFSGTAAFDQNLGYLDLNNVGSITGLIRYAGLSTANYDKTLIAWSKQSLSSPRFLIGDGLTYCHGAAARQRLIDSGWFFLNDTQDCTNQEFITTWTTTTANESITIPTFGGDYDYNVNWGDGTDSLNQTGSATHTYTSAGTYTVTITGEFPYISLRSSPDATKLQTIEQWGTISWSSMESAFYGCSNLTYNATDAPDLSNVTSMDFMFRACSKFNGDISSWNTSNVTNMSYLFLSCTDFNQPLNNWDVSNVTSMLQMFLGAASFNQSLNNWDVGKVQDMQNMFTSAGSFNQDISSWNTASVTSMNSMFRFASAFNQDISSWNTSQVTDMSSMFLNATAFDQNLGSWDIRQVSSLSFSFFGTAMSTENYDKTLIGWAGQNVQNGVALGANSINYCLSKNDRQKLIDDFGWTIIDAGESCPAIPTIWDGAAWDNGAPTATSIALIEGAYNSATNGSFTTDQLWVKPGNILTVDGGASVSAAGNLYNYGTVNVTNDNSFIQTATAPVNEGNGTYSVAREGADYHGVYNYWSSPVQNTTISTVFGSNGKSFYTFDASTQAWQSANRAVAIPAGQGFTATGLSSPATTVIRTFSDNVGFNSGEITQALSYSGSFDANNNWHLVGNPYPSGLDVSQFLSANTFLIEDAVYLWSSDGSDYRSSSSDYATMNSMGTVNAGGSGVAPSSATISSCQGFFVQSKAVGSLTFSNNQRVATNNTFLRTTSEDAKIWIGVENQNGVKNEILIGFVADAEEGKDGYDANKLSGNGFVSLYSIGDFKSGARKLAIQGLPSFTESVIVPIGIEAKEAGEFVFSINHLEGVDELTEIYLHDSETGKIMNLRSGEYKINLAKGEYNDRFELRFVEGKVTSLPNELTDLGIKLYASYQSVVVQFSSPEFAKSEVGVYDTSGRLIGRVNNEQSAEVTIPVVQTGIYIVRIANEAGVVSKKLFVE